MDISIRPPALTPRQPARLPSPNLSRARSCGASPSLSSKTAALIRIVVADDQLVVRRGIAACLSKAPHLEIVGEAADGFEALRKITELRPDVVLMDIDMPQASGLTVTERLQKESPQVKVLLFSMPRQMQVVMRIIESGARGCVTKDARAEELMEAIEKVHCGETYFSPEVARLALTRFVRHSSNGGVDEPLLTPREREVLTHIADGLSNKEISTVLGVSTRTVETHRERIMRKLNIHNTAGLTRYAIANGYVAL